MTTMQAGMGTNGGWRMPSVDWLRIGMLALLLALLAGCAGPQRITGGTTDAFVREGRFSLMAESPNQQPDAVQGGFAWNDDGRRLRFDLVNPVGTVMAQVRVEPGSAVLVRSNGDTERATDPDALAARVLGQNVPVSGLRAWLRGHVSDRATQVRRDDQGRVAAFQEDGWHADLSRFDAQGPRLVRLSRQDGGTRVQLRLVIDSD